MDARDFRGLGRPAQEALRRRALYLVEREGMTQAQAARAVGVHRQTVNIWHKRYRERGEDGLLDGRRVPPRRAEGRLTADEARQGRGWIAEGSPDRLGLPVGLWTSRTAREVHSANGSPSRSGVPSPIQPRTCRASSPVSRPRPRRGDTRRPSRRPSTPRSR